MHAAVGILTARGDMTSHTTIVARGWGKCCVSGCSEIRVNDSEKMVLIGDKVVNEGDWISLNGSTSEVILRKQALSPPALTGDVEIFMLWAYELRRLKVMANVDTPEDALTTWNNGAEGIGLPVTIRLLDPPLHEFLPEGDIEQIVGELTVDTGMSQEEIYSRIEKLSEVNPMLGFRGCRLGISYPKLSKMQVRAIFQAAISLSNQGAKVHQEIMELSHQVSLIRGVAEKVFSEMGSSVSYKVGTMIEIPRAALVADEIAKEAEFYSFGTNDLTQMTFGYRRDDVGKFLPIYLSKGILQHDPFVKGVGQLIMMTTERGRATRPSLKDETKSRSNIGSIRLVCYHYSLFIHYLPVLF
ncbi:pyruvate phosphate dikinase family protein [Striga asiatica]|uniref:pyruvate, phosphate dikinase n=1 Tax=Striga asiatica TaxID=4170 RepID=A0A5A7RFC3_STRAF|nr:pyruvate phosphate dikinase family protein [Striga asiatica]